MCAVGYCLVTAMMLAFCPSLGASPRPAVTSPFEVDENGHPVLNVTLHDKTRSNQKMTYRFMFDTGSSLSVLDASIPSQFYCEDVVEAELTDATGGKARPAAILLKRMDVAGMFRDDLPALRMDLKGTMGTGQDQPVDGILGMNFLAETRFLLDFERRRIDWWQFNLKPSVTLGLRYDRMKLPYLEIAFLGKPLACLLDTGAMGGFELPRSLGAAAAEFGVINQGLLGQVESGACLPVQRLDAGPAAWNNLPVDFLGSGETGTIGTEVWSAAPVCFDFIANCVTFQVEEGQGLPIHRVGRLSLPVLWDRSCAVPVLKVVAVKPGSAMARAGCRVGDRLVRAGTLAGRALTRRSLLALVAKGEPHQWRVRRGGDLVTLSFVGGEGCAL